MRPGGFLAKMQKEPAQLFFVEPMEYRPVDPTARGRRLEHEIKFDGYCAIALKQREVRKIVRRTNDIGRNIGRERGNAERKHRDDKHDRICEMRQDIDRIPNRLAVNDRGR